MNTVIKNLYLKQITGKESPTKQNGTGAIRLSNLKTVSKDRK